MDVLVVEDDPKTAQWLRLYLERDGLAVTTTADGEAALRLVEAEMPRLLLVDVMVPGLDGFEVCRAVRSSSSTPVMLITARASEEDRLRGFEVGADDYITKPFSPREVVARVRAVLRRTQTETQPPQALHVGAVMLRTDAMTLHAGGADVRLTPVESRLLATLFAAPGRTWTRAQLVTRVFGDTYDGTERTIDVHIKNVRRKLDGLPCDDAGRPRIETAHGVGYRLTCEV